MAPLRFRKKPVVIQAQQMVPDVDTLKAIAEWCGGAYGWQVAADGTVKYARIAIKTFEGTMEAHLGDWIIRGVAGEFYPCKLEIFEQTYEVA